MTEPTTKMVKGLKAAVIKGQGSYEKVGPLFEELFNWLKGKGLQPSGPSFGVYFDNPDEVPPERCRYEVGFPITGEAPGDDRVTIKEYPQFEAAVIQHQGPYSQIGPVWGRLYQWLGQQGYRCVGPSREVYLRCPAMVQSDAELLTEIQVPITR